MEAVECGAASLAMILGYHGSFIPLERLRVECGVSRDGSKASKIVLAARRLGLEANGYKRDIDGLKDATFPAIIFWDFNHFVVLEGFKGGKAYINDPASGRRTVTYDEFDSSYTGVILEFSKGENFAKQGKKPSIFTALRRRVEGMESVLLYVVLLGLFLLVPGFVVPAFSRFFVDSILVAKLNGFLKPLLIAMGLAALLTGVITWSWLWVFSPLWLTFVVAVFIAVIILDLNCPVIALMIPCERSLLLPTGSLPSHRSAVRRSSANSLTILANSSSSRNTQPPTIQYVSMNFLRKVSFPSVLRNMVTRK